MCSKLLPGNCPILFCYTKVWEEGGSCACHASREGVQTAHPLQVLFLKIDEKTRKLSGAVSLTGRPMAALLSSRAEMQNPQKAQIDANVCSRWQKKDDVPELPEYISSLKQSSLKGPVPLFRHTAVPILVKDEVKELHPAKVGKYLRIPDDTCTLSLFFCILVFMYLFFYVFMYLCILYFCIFVFCIFEFLYF